MNKSKVLVPHLFEALLHKHQTAQVFQKRTAAGDITGGEYSEFSFLFKVK